MPDISIILTVYNGINYLDKSVTSVLQQDYKDFEFLILDNCSTDDTWKYLQLVKDDRIKLYRNEKTQGVFFNLNFLIRKTTSPLIKLWAHDDIMYPYCLQTIVAFHLKHPEIGFSYSDRDIIDANGVIRNLDFIDNTPEIVTPDLHARIAFFTGSIAGNISNVCLNKKALYKVGLFNEEMQISADFDMWVRLAKDHDTGFISRKLIKLRDHEGQLSRKENFYIYHVKEDLRVYRNLLSYVNPQIRKEGKLLLKNYKLVFYYTLMVKALMQGKLKTAHSFYKELCSMDNFLSLSIAFIKAKILKPAKPEFLK
ncbi:MAG: glycosyltransferase [Ginsengibacter sp.]